MATKVVSSSSRVWQSAVASLLVQLIVGGVTVAGFFLPLPEGQEEAIRVVLALESGSQAIEFVWYLIVVCRFRTILTWTRYLDWVISTPIMLVSIAMFFRMRGGESENVSDVFLESALWVSLGLNWLMLGLGFALETSVLPARPALLGGFAALVGSFTSLARFVPAHDATSVTLFFTMYAIWFLYGIAAMLDYEPKNIAYSALDIVSKNFYGVFLFVYVLMFDEWFASV